MSAMTLFLMVCSIIAGGLLAYTYTASGKKWLQSL